MKTAIVVGSGAGGATVAKELQGAFDVTVLEAGKAFHPFTRTIDGLEWWRRRGLLFDAREIGFVFPYMKIRKVEDGLILVNGVGLGGTTTICTGSGVRADGDLKALGIDLEPEFDAIAREIPLSTAHERGWCETTRRLFAICGEMDLTPRPMPKMGEYERCAHCGRCVFGCPHGVKWDSRQFLKAALDNGARLATDCVVERVEIESGRAMGVQVKEGRRHDVYSADLIVLAAGGLGTPVILENSGIPCEPSLFVDPVLCVAGRAEGCHQCYEVEMPFVVQRDGFILSPYFDYLSFFFDRDWRYPAGDIVGIMIKIADESAGSVGPKHVHKQLTPRDRRRLDEGAGLAREILCRFGVAPEETFQGMLNAGHPGGSLPLTEREAGTLHHDRLPPNLYVADATLLPRSLGNPPILTIVALAKRVGRLCAERLAA
jgi:choline dehydrogenase-like flavoprotein